MASEKEFKTLPLQFVRAGVLWSQLDRTADKAIYAGSIGNFPVEHEVIKIRHIDAQEGSGKHIAPPGEHFPTTSQWGARGWSIMSRRDAMEKYNSL